MNTPFSEILTGLSDGTIVPYLGPGALSGVTDKLTEKRIPADSDSLILAMNNGQPMAPKLMFEFPRAAMNVELKRGRSTVNRFLDTTYRDTKWTISPLHEWLAKSRIPYIIDTNRDMQLQEQYKTTPHTLIVGTARIASKEYRFRLFNNNGTGYSPIEPEAVDTSLPVLFKPLGTPLPESNYIASDADFVDYITELMGGFAIPPFVKRMRQHKRYLVLGQRFNRDTERMVFSEIIFGADGGWALIPNPTDKEKRFLARFKIEIINAEVDGFLSAARPAAAAVID